VVADQDGTADIVGGTLQSPEGAAYAAFQTDASEGTYSATVTWAALNTVLEIEFTGEATRSFIATFYDQAGATVSQTVDVTLFCDTGAACDGVCWDVTEDVMNCGACGNVCPKMEPEDGAAWDTRCTLGRCLVKTECFRSRNVSCDLACANEGYVCDEENGGYYGDVIGYFVNFDQAVCDYDDAEKIESCSERISEHEAASDFVSGYCFCWEQR
jgi:hypothetical protein